VVLKLLLGILAGIIFGAASVATMIPLRLQDKKNAMAGAFLNRFVIGFVTGTTSLPVPSWLSGLIFGVLISLPDAIITKAWKPVMALGAIGGLIIGFTIGAWGT
jgi:hypothetical protein